MRSDSSSENASTSRMAALLSRSRTYTFLRRLQRSKILVATTLRWNGPKGLIDISPNYVKSRAASTRISIDRSTTSQNRHRLVRVSSQGAERMARGLKVHLRSLTLTLRAREMDKKLHLS